jgi:hypothetical protein
VFAPFSTLVTASVSQCVLVISCVIVVKDGIVVIHPNFLFVSSRFKLSLRS